MGRPPHFMTGTPYFIIHPIASDDLHIARVVSVPLKLGRLCVSFALAELANRTAGVYGILFLIHVYGLTAASRRRLS